MLPGSVGDFEGPFEHPPLWWYLHERVEEKRQNRSPSLFLNYGWTLTFEWDNSCPAAFAQAMAWERLHQK